jgi:hypothetical protein
MLHVSKNAIKKAVQECWLSEGGAPAAELEFTNGTKYTRYLLDLQYEESMLNTTYTVSLNVCTDLASRIAMYTQVMDTRILGSMVV